MPSFKMLEAAPSYTYKLRHGQMEDHIFGIGKDSNIAAYLYVGLKIDSDTNGERLLMTIENKSASHITNEYIMLSGFEGTVEALAEHLGKSNVNLRITRLSPRVIEKFYQLEDDSEIIKPLWKENDVLFITDDNQYHFEFLVNPDYPERNFSMSLNLYPGTGTGGLTGRFDPIVLHVELPAPREAPVVVEAELTEMDTADDVIIFEETIQEEGRQQAEDFVVNAESAHVPSLPRDEPVSESSAGIRELTDITEQAKNLYTYLFTLHSNIELHRVEHTELDSCLRVIGSIRTEFDRLHTRLNVNDIQTKLRVDGFIDYYDSINTMLEILRSEIENEETLASSYLENENLPAWQKTSHFLRDLVLYNSELIISGLVLIGLTLIIMIVSLRKSRTVPVVKQSKKKEKKPKLKSHYDLKKEAFVSGKRADTIKI